MGQRPLGNVDECGRSIQRLPRRSHRRALPFMARTGLGHGESTALPLIEGMHAPLRHADSSMCASDVLATTRSSDAQVVSETQGSRTTALDDSQSPPSSTCTSSVVTTPVVAARLKQLLAGYNPTSTQYLFTGFTQGFRIGCLDIPPPSAGTVPNLLSARVFPKIIEQKISKELAANRIRGPYNTAPKLSNF